MSCSQVNLVNLEIQVWKVLLVSVANLAGRETTAPLVSLVREPRSLLQAKKKRKRKT